MKSGNDYTSIPDQPKGEPSLKNFPSEVVISEEEKTGMLFSQWVGIQNLKTSRLPSEPELAR